MTSAFDPRVVRVGLQTSAKDFLFFEDLDIRVQGQKFANPTSSYCTVKISNLTRDQRNFILTTATPVTVKGKDRTPIFVTVDVGRKYNGAPSLFRLFEGTVYTSTVTPPPDIGITLRSLAQSEFTGLIQSNSQGLITQLETIAKSIADQNGLMLKFKATPKQIANYTHDGAVTKQLQKLQEVGGVLAYIDGKTLVVTDQYGFNNDAGFVLKMETGMVGVPQATESGCIAQMLVAPNINIGDKISVQSKINPSVNGSDYNIRQIAFDIANRDTPFFYTLTLSNQLIAQGTQ